ncbi:O-antigen ligase family protein [Rubinisphaera sp. JC750]|uniref:O-antigen ligase family protein n=1 Tax=Rubinisphaera sp. JC750 TaxID=2898658 RepID=UPI001F326B99|nr:O-antigen ligase family protein [Rubinisphaera sp. JC750]
MSKKSQQTAKKRVDSAETSTAATPERFAGETTPLLQSGLIATTSLFFARWWVPVESAAAGDTALLVLPWMLLLALAGWLVSTGRFPKTFLKFDLADLGLGLIALGALVGCGSVWSMGGQLRAAFNMTWEWLGIIVAVFLLRRFWGATRSSAPVAVLLGIGLTLSAQGIYQHSVQLPSQRAVVLPMVEEYQETYAQLQSTELSPAARERLLSAQQSQERLLFQNGIPSEPRSLQMFVERLNSSEPFAQFALTNTLAGVLLICLLLQLSLGIRLFRSTTASSRGAQVFLAVAVVATFYCLVLTKSRTAWVAGLMGIVLLALQRPRNQNARRHILQAGAVAVLLLVLGVGGGLLTGALDLEVITEANKSLSYRVEYWTASLAMLQDHWATGVGPGNFRQNYLAYKLPYSSEEILDPHNLWLDAWAGNGLLGLLGLAIVVFFMLRRAWNQFLSPAVAESDFKQSVDQSVKPAVIATALSGLWAMLFVSPEIAPLIEVVALLAFLGTIAAAGFGKLLNQSRPAAYAMTVAALAAIIHLHGAGGFAMPGIISAVLLLGLGPRVFDEKSDEFSQPSKSWAAPAAMGLAILLLIGGTSLVVRPELASWTATARLANANSSRAAQIALNDWAEADSVNPAPWMQLGQMYASMAKETPGSDRDAYAQAAVTALKKAAPLDPANHHVYQAIAAVYAEQATAGKADAWTEAVRNQQLAVDRYPGSAELQADLSAYLASAGRTNDAAKVATKALEIHELNEKAGHVDRLLDGETVDALKKRTNGTETPNTSQSGT